MHQCNKSGGGVTWSLCIVCEGRIHASGCTSRRRPDLDCCEARHRKLHDSGRVWGLGDASLPMFDPANVTWASGPAFTPARARRPGRGS